MFIIRYPYSHQYKRVIVIVYWSEYPDEVIHVFYFFVTVCPLRGDWFLLFPCRCGSTPWRNIYRTTPTTSIQARWNTHSPRILCRACPCKKLWRYKHIFFHFYTPEVKLWTYYGMAFVRPSVRPGRQKGTCWVQKYPTNVHLWERPSVCPSVRPLATSCPFNILKSLWVTVMVPYRKIDHGQ